MLQVTDEVTEHTYQEKIEDNLDFNNPVVAEKEKQRIYEEKLSKEEEAFKKEIEEITMKNMNKYKNALNDTFSEIMNGKKGVKEGE